MYLHPNDLKNLNFNEVAAWPSAIKRSIFIAIGVFFFILGFFIFNIPQHRTLSRVKQYEQELKEILKVETPQVLAQQQQMDQLKQVKNLVTQHHALLPKPEQLSNVSNDLTKSAVNNQLELILLKPEPVQQEEFYARIPIKIEVIGDYSQLVKFIHQVANLSYYVYLKNLNITLVNTKMTQTKEAKRTVPTDALRLQMTAEMYYFAPMPKPEKQEPKHGSKH